MREAPPWLYSVGVLAMAVALSSAASAQVATPAIQPGQRIQEVDLIGDIIYESNVASSDAALAAARGLKLSDEIFEPRVRLIFARPIGRETVYLQGDAGYDFHVRNSVLNRENLDIRPGILGQVGSCQPSLTGEYSRAQSELSELARSPAGLVIPFQEKNTLQVEEVGGSATCGRATGLAPSVSASETWTQNTSTLQHFIDAQTFSGSAGLAYRRPTLGSLQLFAALSQTDYPNRAALSGIAGAGVATGYRTLSGGVTYTRAVGSRLQGQVSISFSKLDQQGATSKGFSGLTYSAALSYQVSTRLQAILSASRATVPSNHLNSTFGIDQNYSARLSYRAGSRLTFDSGASYAHDMYNGIPYPLGFDLTDESTYTVFGNADLQLTRRLLFELNVQHRQRDANYPGLSFPDTRVGLTARATF